MYNKVYKRFPIKLWENECESCCMECYMEKDCKESCVRDNITCNQCKYGGENFGTQDYVQRL